MTLIALTGAAIFDGNSLLNDHALLLENGTIAAIAAQNAVPKGAVQRPLEGGTLMPGFVDLQVNGGGGVMFNDETTVEGVAAIARAHATTGTCALLPTLITDTPERTRAAVAAVEAAIAQGVLGIVGVHLEGPHLSLARKGAHDPALIRMMDDTDETFLLDAAHRLPNLMVTVAPENVTMAQIARLSDAGVLISLGHTDCSYDVARAAFAAGACCTTHLFNAMSQMGNREPGLVGATLDTGTAAAGLIADGIHVHAASIRAALSAKSNPAPIFLVTDAMSTVGSDITEFHLNGRRVLRRDGRLTLEDGTLAGADLTMTRALSVLINDIGVSAAHAFAMATSAPASVLTQPHDLGHLVPGAPWTGLYLDAEFTPVALSL